MHLNIHKKINDKLDYFYTNNNIPNIIFHGSSGTGKRTIVYNFIKKIYHNDKKIIKDYVMIVDCAHGKGIKFIREDLKLFAKTNIHINTIHLFKVILLLNADKLTIDAQSALRRCIELFSGTTRFFIIVQNKYHLLKPILSRFCEIYIPELVVNNKVINLHKLNINPNLLSKNNMLSSNLCHMELDHNTLEPKVYNMNADDINIEDIIGLSKIKRAEYFKKLISHEKKHDEKNLLILVKDLYEKGYSSIDITYYIENLDKLEILEKNKFQLLICIEKIKKEFRNEKLLMYFILYFLLIRSDYNLENISFM